VEKYSSRLKPYQRGFLAGDFDCGESFFNPETLRSVKAAAVSPDGTIATAAAVTPAFSTVRRVNRRNRGIDVSIPSMLPPDFKLPVIGV